MHYQLFIPNMKTLDPAKLADLGLPGFEKGAQWHELSAEQSPCEKLGVLVTYPKPGGPIHQNHINTDRQEWIPAASDGMADDRVGRYWMGFWKDDPATPEDLLLPGAVGGRNNGVLMGDGNRWLIPSIAYLNMDFVLSPDGRYTQQIPERFTDYVWGIMALFNRNGDEMQARFDVEELFPHIIRGLKFNYRLTSEVAFHLRLFNTQTTVAAFSEMANAGMALIEGSAV